MRMVRRRFFRSLTAATDAVLLAMGFVGMARGPRVHTMYVRSLLEAHFDVNLFLNLFLTHTLMLILVLICSGHAMRGHRQG